MIQSFDTQLQVVLRALREVVAPALSGGAKHVVEQLHLSMATLEFMRGRMPHARRFSRQELQAYIALAEEVMRIVAPEQAASREQMASIVASAKSALDRPECENEDYQAVTRQLRERIAAATTAAVATPYESALEALIVRSSQDMLQQDRLWCVPFGFELKPEELPPPKW
jgi:hypothetical protein